MGQRDPEQHEPDAIPAPRVRVTAGPQRWTGRLDSHADARLSVYFDLAEEPTLRLGGRVIVHLADAEGTWHPSRAAVQGREDRDDGRLYHFVLRTPESLAPALPPQSEPAPIARREHRLVAPHRAAWITVTAMQGPDQGRRVAGTLLDVSTHGLGMLLDLAAEDLLAESPTVTCTFAAPGSAGQRIRAGRIVHRTRHGPKVRYGVSFIGEMVGPEGAFTPAPVSRRGAGGYEPAWDCTRCGTFQLLGQTHRFCPGCGAPRGDQPTYFPHWDDSELNTEHWAWGDERLCPFCAVSFSDLANHCGRCGRQLPT